MSDPTSNTPATGDVHADPITGEPGFHPVGTGVGAASAGTAGAAIGAVVGPAGAMVGAAIGAAIGGVAGHGVAEKIDPTAHELYWQHNHPGQPYATKGGYNEYSGAYRTGYEGLNIHGPGKDFSDVEGDLKSSYEKTKEEVGLAWEHAKDATKAAYDHARAEVKKD